MSGVGTSARDEAAVMVRASRMNARGFGPMGIRIRTSSIVVSRLARRVQREAGRLLTGRSVAVTTRPMPYAEGRRFYDADSHLMETPEWLASHAEPGFR